MSAAKSNSPGGGSHAQIASSAVTTDQERLASRLLAVAGLAFLLSGLLAALSFVILALVAFAVMLLPIFVLLTMAGRWLVERSGTGEGLETMLSSAERALRALKPRVDQLWTRAAAAANAAPRRTNALLVRGARSYAIAADHSRTRTTQLLQPDARPARALSRLNPRQVDRHRRALQLNELGAELRRDGDHEHAAEQHRVALEIVRDLGDQEAEALTLNSLALALAHHGAEAEAVQHLEQALLVLRELGDDEREGRVIANLGFVHRRQGHIEEAINLLHAALDKLPPESAAYRQVEEELRRAS